MDKDPRTGRCKTCNAIIMCGDCFESLEQQIEKTLSRPVPFDKNDMTVGEYYDKFLKGKEDVKSNSDRK